MAKGKKHQPHADQLGFVFEAPVTASEPAALAGLERQISRAVSEMLKGDDRDRAIIAAEMSILLDEEISGHMLNAYASPAREDHKVPASRFFALVAVTKRHDLFDRIARHIGAAVLVGEEVQTARLGQIDQQMRRLKEERARLATSAPLIRGGRLL